MFYTFCKACDSNFKISPSIHSMEKQFVVWKIPSNFDWFCQFSIIIPSTFSVPAPFSYWQEVFMGSNEWWLCLILQIFVRKQNRMLLIANSNRNHRVTKDNSKDFMNEERLYLNKTLSCYGIIHHFQKNSTNLVLICIREQIGLLTYSNV